MLDISKGVCNCENHMHTSNTQAYRSSSSRTAVERPKDVVFQTELSVVYRFDPASLFKMNLKCSHFTRPILYFQGSYNGNKSFSQFVCP